MRNRVHRPAYLDRSKRYVQERQAQRHAQRDPLVLELYRSRRWHELPVIESRAPIATSIRR